MGKTRIRLAVAAAAVPAALGMAIAAPAMALADNGGNNQHAGQYSHTTQNATSGAYAPQYNKASNVSLFSPGSGVVQANPNRTSANAGNGSSTSQSQHQPGWLHAFLATP